MSAEDISHKALENINKCVENEDNRNIYIIVKSLNLKILVKIYTSLPIKVRLIRTKL